MVDRAHPGTPAGRIRGRRRPARGIAAALVLAGTAVIALSGMGGTAANAPAPPRSSPTPTPSSCYQFGDFQFCSSPTPDTIVVSPLPSVSPSPSVTPPDLIGLTPSPSDTGQDVGGIVAPLDGGTTTNPPNSGGGPAPSSVTNNGLPLPVLFLGLVLASSIAGLVLWRVAPRGAKLPVVEAPPPVLFTPYGSSDTSSAPVNLLDPAVNRPDSGRSRQVRPRSAR
jgi:hypothetical protein